LPDLLLFLIVLPSSYCWESKNMGEQN